MGSQQRANSTRRRSGHSRKSSDSLSKPPLQLVGPLSEVMLRLRFVHAASVTAALALRALNAEQDVDVADCLRMGVCDPLDQAISQLRSIIEGLGRKPAEPDARSSRLFLV